MEAWEFGRTVSRWRARTSSESVGLPAGSRRRAPGLRREELAGLTGISTDYLTRLEQGRATSPSAQVVEALARALRLSDAERSMLYELAGLAAPGPDLVPTRITPSVHRLLDRLVDTPVAVFDASWNLLIANRPYDALMGDTTTWTGRERNSVWRNFVGPGTRAVQSPEEKRDFLAGLAGDLRRTAGRYPADGTLQELVRSLRSSSALFAELWDAGDPVLRFDTAKQKVIDHPSVGRIQVDCDVLAVATDDVRIMVYSAEPGSPEAERLILAIVLGTQELVG